MSGVEEPGDAGDYLRVLELTPGATMAEVKTAHRVLVKIWDPATLPDPEKRSIAADKRRSIDEAYEWLCQHPSALEQVMKSQSPSLSLDGGPARFSDLTHVSNGRQAEKTAPFAVGRGLLVLIGLLIALVGASWVLPPSVRDVQGKITSAEETSPNEYETVVQPTDSKSEPLAIRYLGRTRLRIGQRVLIEESTTAIFGGKRYRFKDPLDERMRARP